ncbi:rhomboid family-domain-containing protein [Catenaria anguillulae PL171]|uniref:Rhomboid-type serine protease n=1 Tax=Catenaria anguillulae PL171 TaxID=765915 RepID=A0A1Y2HCB8_9FUNG|nr:rhomboid family-domain-containing protein [Catenaria anguillulae PL171]
MPTYRPYFVWLVTALQTAGLVWSLVWSYQRTGQVIATQPFNFMIGPSADVLVQMGARFTGCMRDVPKLMPDGTGEGLACMIPNPLGKYPNLAPGSPDLYTCNWEVMCGDLAGSTQPRVANQWFRFATAMFLHAGVVHFAMNILFQWTAVKSLERDWGWFRIAPVYILAGLFGFIFGGSFADAYSPSVGCSGALFGMVACLLIDHIQNWRIIHHPTTQLLRMLFVIIITFFLGLFPGIDNFSHVGGFIIGLLMGIVVMPNINLSFCSGSRKGKPSPEAKQDSGFGRACFSGYSTVSLIARAVCLIVTVALFVAMVPLFYGGNAESKCSWCHYIDCLPALAPGGQCGAQTVAVTQVTQKP